MPKIYPVVPDLNFFSFSFAKYGLHTYLKFALFTKRILHHRNQYSFKLLLKLYSNDVKSKSALYETKGV